MKLTALATAITTSLTFGHLAQANEYQQQVEIGYLEANSDYDDEANAFRLTGTHYFAPVDYAGLPLGEAAFLRKSSSFSLEYAQSEYEGYGGKDTDKLRAADIGYYVPNTMFYVGAGIQQYKSNDHRSYYPEDNARYESDWHSRWVARLGLTPVDGLLVWSEFYEHVDISDYWNLNAKYVKLLANDRAVSIESRFANVNVDDAHAIDVVGDYYFNSRFSVGVGAHYYEQDHDGDGSDADFLARTSYFFTDSIGVSAAYVDQGHADVWTIEATLRF